MHELNTQNDGQHLFAWVKHHDNSYLSQMFQGVCTQITSHDSCCQNNTIKIKFDYTYTD